MDQHFIDNIFKFIFLEESHCTSGQILLKFIPKEPIDENSAFVQVMAWCLRGDKPESEWNLEENLSL